MFGFLKWLFGSAQERTVRKYRQTVTEINSIEIELQSLTDAQVRAKTDELRERIRNGEDLDALLPEAYAVVKNVCRRLVGTDVHVSGYDQKWDMIPFDVQMIGAIALHKGSIAEMQTGEGKTLTEIMPLYLNALTGKPVHLVTVNDYLAKRDCEWVGSILRWLGITTASLTHDVPPGKRHSVYAADIVYGTAAEFGFDYLRDNSMASSKAEQVQRGFYYAIIDEVDSILIDEARTPLIISGPVSESRQMYDQLKDRVAQLVKMQRELCNGIASECRKQLDKGGLFAEEQRDNSKISKEQLATEKEALRKLWLVSKGMPKNKAVKSVKENPDLRAALDKWDLYYHSDQNKEERTTALAQLYMIVDEKSNEFELTDRGIAAWIDLSSEEHVDDFTMLDISAEYIAIDQDSTLDSEAKLQRKLAVQEVDALRKERSHNLRQLLRAHLLMERDVDYIVVEGKIVIIDENTGRPQPGRRFSDGLHQAIEAKEGVSIQDETQTYATITLQNFFRMYEKLAGMTGTAATEANEFKQIYKLDVLEIPTHRPCIRVDHHDEIYMTEREKYNAILKDVRLEHEKGRPILIGTESVDVSEKLSRVFRQNGLTHNVLNAKYHELEAEIIAHAGKKGAITISTNMAGRGTDIKLEPGVADFGGLYVIGTARHQSRRIDRQLRGRSARLGDPGSTRFYISFEDSLLRLFASPRLTAIIQRFRPPEGEPIGSAPMLDRSVATAQKRLEERNYTIRKHTLEYDDVMNRQRQEIYAFRNEILHCSNPIVLAEDLLQDFCSHAAEKYFRSRSGEGEWDPEGFRLYLMENIPVSFSEGYFDLDHASAQELQNMAFERILEAFRSKLAVERAKIPPIPPGTVDPIESAVRDMMTRKTDQLWQEHLLAMDHLRSEVNLRAVGQRDPLIEFKQEAFITFDAFSRQLHVEIAHVLFRFKIFFRQEHPPLEALLQRIQMETTRSLYQESLPEIDQEEEPESEKPPQLLLRDPKHSRNDLCPCGSGKKYKKCCGAQTAVRE